MKKQSYNTYVHSTPKNPIALLVLITLITGCGWLVTTQQPESLILISLFFILTFLIIFTLFVYLGFLRSKAFLWATGVIVFLLLRIFGLHNFLYTALLIATVFSLHILDKKPR